MTTAGEVAHRLWLLARRPAAATQASPAMDSDTVLEGDGSKGEVAGGCGDGIRRTAAAGKETQGAGGGSLAAARRRRTSQGAAAGGPC